MANRQNIKKFLQSLSPEERASNQQEFKDTGSFSKGFLKSAGNFNPSDTLGEKKNINASVGVDTGDQVSSRGDIGRNGRQVVQQGRQQPTQPPTTIGGAFQEFSRNTGETQQQKNLRQQLVDMRANRPTREQERQQLRQDSGRGELEDLQKGFREEAGSVQEDLENIKKGLEAEGGAITKIAASRLREARSGPLREQLSNFVKGQEITADNIEQIDKSINAILEARRLDRQDEVANIERQIELAGVSDEEKELAKLQLQQRLQQIQKQDDIEAFRQKEQIKTDMEIQEGVRKGEIDPEESSTGASYNTSDSVDFSTNQDIINQYPNEASFKNNNPTGITFQASSKNLKNLWDEAGVSYSKGTERPTEEGGNYVKFDSVQDGLEAYGIAFTQAGSNDVYERLKTWVGTDEGDNYAQEIMDKAGIEKGTKFDDLRENNPELLEKLFAIHLQKESPGFYNEISKIKQGNEVDYNPDKIPQYTAFIEDKKIPVGLKPGTKAYKQFIANAKEGYIDSQNEVLQQKGFSIENPNSYTNIDKDTRKDVRNAINNVQPFVQSMDKVIEMVKEFGTETTLSTAGKQMNQEIKNAQLLAKEIYNLGVLNGPDLSLMEAIISNPTSLSANAQVWTDYVKLLENGKKTVLDNAKQKAKGIGLSFNEEEEQQGEEVVYTDKDGIDYTPQGLEDELNRMIEAGELTEERALEWLEENNLSTIL